MPMWEVAVAHIAARLKEPSSWAGLAGVATAVGVTLNPDFTQSIGLIGAGVASIVAILLPEGSGK